MQKKWNILTIFPYQNMVKLPSEFGDNIGTKTVS